MQPSRTSGRRTMRPSDTMGTSNMGNENPIHMALTAAELPTPSAL